MITVKNEGIILEKTNLEFENKAVFNPACIQVDGVTHMFYRAINHNDVSSVGYCQLVDNKVVKRLKEPVLFPQYDYEKKGVEDPRITLLEGTYYLLYTAHDGKNALIAYATSKDLVHFVKQGLISPKISYDEAEDIFRGSKKVIERYTAYEMLCKEKGGKDILLFEKNASLFPQKFNHKFALLHRILPGIQIIYFNNFSELTENRWRDYLKNLGDFIVLDPLFWFENRKIGGGCPPIKTKDGWLIIYHAVEDTPFGEIYHASAALLDLKNPLKVLGRLKEPLFSPETSWEKSGVINNVVFPTGAVIKDKRLYIYYGAADKLIAARSVDLTELLTELKKTP
ncbi:MAG: pesticidal protein Cry7Aa [Candidatus Nealsonbacteria bacterium CG02_land_8_20_14_3_00_37_10]|uniref:Pesticidal protein Cry7Aa n=1 Tax=Candidatus Nealsonbacteria bacterium CG02_land_8_20_14_3_00_37_10 TaxID=1974699 RepID=A0A2M7D985_9BACT|nr:MAG: pesticidal protein Cry7Aa [Candidatus Nealsonbacteria bacterium CG02_land_8_20_14_3_00_37_10]